MNKKDCEKKSYYSPMLYSYWRAIQQDASRVQAIPNVHGRNLTGIIQKAFQRITASVDDEPFMEDVYCYPEEACFYASERMKQIYESVDNDLHPGEKTYRILQKEYIKKITDEIILHAKLTKPGSGSNGIDKIILWAGEKGIGKTTFINHIFLKNRRALFEKQIIWIRYSVFFRRRPKNIKEVKEGFYKTIINIISRYYKNTINLEDMAVKSDIWKRKINDLGLHDPDEINKKIFEWKNDLKLYAENIMRYMYKRDWSFTLILDNIDQYDDHGITKDIVTFAADLCRCPVRSVVIVVARTETINDHISFFKDQHHNIERKDYIPSPNFGELFSKRLSFIKTRLKDFTTVRSRSSRYRQYKLNEGDTAIQLIKFCLTPAPNNPEEFLIAELANHNIRLMFEMVNSILTTHVTDVTETPIEALIEGQKLGQEVHVDETLRNHLLVWALMLKDNYLHYRSTESWLANLYNVEHEADSYFLKRLILDFLLYMKENDMQYVEERQLKRVFCVEMSFLEDEIDRVLVELTDRINTVPFVSFVYANSNSSNKLLCLSPKGEVYTTFLAELFTYIELVLEDTLLPIKLSEKQGLDISLLSFEPLEETSRNKRREETIQFFLQKRKHVSEFIDFLECKERKERISHNNFFSVSTGFRKQYFPSMRRNINIQANKITNALRI